MVFSDSSIVWENRRTAAAAEEDRWKAIEWINENESWQLTAEQNQGCQAEEDSTYKDSTPPGE